MAYPLNTPFVAVLTDAPLDLVGLGVRLEMIDGTVVIPRSETGIALRGDGSYAVTLTTPVTPGVYVVVWDADGVQAREKLSVGSGGRSPVDGLRSLKKYVAEVLPEYELRTSREEGTFSRPFGRVGLAGTASYPIASGTLIADVIQPFTVHLYPRVGDTPDESLLITLAEEERLYRAFRGRGVGLGRPLRIPLYNWDGVPLTATSSVRHPSDHMRISDVSIDRQIDSDNERLTFISVDVRCTWRRVIPDPSTAPVVASVLTTPTLL